MEAPLTIEGVAPAAPVEAGAVPVVPAQAGANPLDIPADSFRAALSRRSANRAALIEWIRQALVEGVDFGVIQTRRGPSKPSLWKAGAEKICGMLGLTASFPMLRDYERAALSGAVPDQIILRCELRDGAGRIVAEGVGARYMRQDSGDLNKALKMAEKSAMIDATLRCAGLSEVFTQDLEDMAAEPDPAPVQAPEIKRINAAMLAVLETRISSYGLDRERVLSWVQRAWGIDDLAKLPRSKFDTLAQRLNLWREQMRAIEANKSEDCIKDLEGEQQ